MTPRFSIGIDLGTTNSALAYVPLAGREPPGALAIPQWDTPDTLVEATTLPSFLYLPEDALAAQLGRTGAETLEALVGIRGDGVHHTTRAATRAPRRALPRRRALCTNSKKPRYSGSFSCEIPRCGRSQERSRDHVPSIVLT